MADDKREYQTLDSFDRALGSLDGLPGAQSTAPATIQLVTPVTGAAISFTIRTFRQQERIEGEEGEKAGPARFTIFLEHSSREAGYLRLVLPPRVADLIARQRDALTGRAQAQASKRAAATRAARGIKPAFLKKRGAK